MTRPTPEELEESDKRMWQAIGLQNRLNRLEREKIWPALVEEGKHITVYADGELIGELNMDYLKEIHDNHS